MSEYAWTDFNKRLEELRELKRKIVIGSGSAKSVSEYRRLEMELMRDLLDSGARIISAEEAEALEALYEQSTPEQGQHELARCRFCHVEQRYHYPYTLDHKEGCPVANINGLIYLA